MRMSRMVTVLSLFAIAGATSPLAAQQQYWEYEPLEDEWERHQPYAGQETEYEVDGRLEYEGTEAEQYEYEPGEGYHEQEWYDPSDWFDYGYGVEYEDMEEDAYGTYDEAYDWEPTGADEDWFDGWFDAGYGDEAGEANADTPRNTMNARAANKADAGNAETGANGRNRNDDWSWYEEEETEDAWPGEGFRREFNHGGTGQWFQTPS